MGEDGARNSSTSGEALALEPSRAAELTLQKELQDVREKCRLLERKVSDLELQLQQALANSADEETSRFLTLQAELEAAKASLENRNAELSEMAVDLRREKEDQVKELEARVSRLTEECQRKDETIVSCERNLKLLETRAEETQARNTSEQSFNPVW